MAKIIIAMRYLQEVMLQYIPIFIAQRAIFTTRVEITSFHWNFEEESSG